jgi:hypothetical protein
MNLPEILTVTLAAFALVGVIGLALVALYWRAAGDLVQDMWPKVLAEGIQGLSGLVSIASAFAAAAKKGEWHAPVIAGSSSVVVWKILQVVIDYRRKAADKVLKEELDRATREGTIRTYLLAVLRKATGRKVSRLRRAIQRRQNTPSLAKLRNALTPQPHLEELIEALALFFLEQLPSETRQTRNFRVGVYLEREGVMQPVHAISLHDPGYNPFNSFQAHSTYFRLDDQENRSHVVRCVREKSLLLVEDCESAAGLGRFLFFNPDQSAYLKSMAAYNLGEVCQEDGTMKKAALVIDTDFAGFFKESEVESLNFYFREFATRLKLEMCLLALTTPRGSSHEPRNQNRKRSEQTGETGAETSGRSDESHET